ncbi:MAG: prolipoprotein diacylglyceryl transferase [bacterium]
MIPELFKIGPLTINSFGVMAMLAFFVPMLLLKKELARKGLDPDNAMGITFAAMIGGLIGARIYFIAERWDIFIKDPANSFGVFAVLLFLIPTFILRKVLVRKGKAPDEATGITVTTMVGVLFGAIIFYIAFIDQRSWGEFIKSPANLIFTGAGLVWYGGLAGGFLAVTWYMHYKKIAIPLICDLAAPVLALGQTFGRMGCLLSGDGDYGPPTDIPWAMAFPKGVIPTTEKVHPTPIYDMIFLLTIFGILWKLRKKEFPTGFKFSIYLVLLGTERTITEFYRNTPKILFGLTVAQLISIGLIITGGTLLVFLKSKETGKLKLSKTEKK